MPLRLIRERRSFPSKQLRDPGPDPEQLRHLIDAALRVPDHGSLDPTRLILVRREAGSALGQKLADHHARLDPQVGPAELDKDRGRFTRAPLCLVVVARQEQGHKVPVIEQVMSAACVAHNLLLGAQALGFGAQWITGWPAHDRGAASILGLTENEIVVAFIHIGTAPALSLPDRPRPNIDSACREWTP